MASLDTKVRKYLEANSKVYLDELNNFSLRDDGDERGEYIETWNLDIPQPTAEQLATYEDAGNAEETAELCIHNRQKEYPDIIDCIHALLDGGDTLTDLQAKRQAVKEKYPKS